MRVGNNLLKIDCSRCSCLGAEMPQIFNIALGTFHRGIRHMDDRKTGLFRMDDEIGQHLFMGLSSADDALFAHLFPCRLQTVA